MKIFFNLIGVLCFGYMAIAYPQHLYEPSRWFLEIIWIFFTLMKLNDLLN